MKHSAAIMPDALRPQPSATIKPIVARQAAAMNQPA